MSYQVFARKYRPQTFAQVIGQEHITRTLANAIKLGRLAQAYLLVGPRGTGKTSTARIIAKALNCSGGPKVDFDPAEEICHEIAEGRCLDVLEIDGASNNGVDQVRDLRDNVRFAPTRGSFKIYIIDEVHMLTTAAFNALLKTLEEPPAHVKFILATTEVHKVLPTVLSRCQRFDFRRIPDALIAQHLSHICEWEKVTAETTALHLIARQADGGLRDAEVALDQVIGFFGNHVTEDSVQQMFGLTGLTPVLSLAAALSQGDVVSVLAQSREMIQGGKDLGRLAQDLLRFFRNLAVYQLSPEAVREEVTPQELTSLQAIGAALSRRNVLALLDELSTFESRLRYALSKEILFEVSLIQLAQLREKVSLETILQQLDQADLSAVSWPIAQPEPLVSAAILAESSPTPVVSPAPAAVSAPASPVRKSVNGAQAWAKATERFATERPLEAASVRLTRYVTSSSDSIEVALPKNLKHKIAFLSAPRNLPILENSLREDFGGPVKIIFFAIDPPVAEVKEEVAESGAKPNELETPKLNEQEFRNDPLIREALELFQARLVASKN